jgi:hypothetical protein
MTGRGERTVLIGQIEMGDVDRFVAEKVIPIATTKEIGSVMGNLLT